TAPAPCHASGVPRSWRRKHPLWNQRRSFSAELRHGLVVWVVAVSLDDNSRLLGPRDPEGRVVPAHAARALRTIKLGHLVQHFRPVLQRQKSMRQALGNINRCMILFAEPHAEMLHVTLRLRSQIDDHVENRTAG